MTKVLVIGGWGFRGEAMATLADALDADFCPWYQVPELTSPTVLVGWSLGGVVASDQIADPQVTAIATLGTPGHFAQQVDQRTFRRLSRNVGRSPALALNQFADWISGGDPRARDLLAPIQLEAGLDALNQSQCALQWRAHSKPQLHLVGDADALFTDPDQARIQGGHCLPWQAPVLVADEIRRWLDAI